MSDLTIIGNCVNDIEAKLIKGFLEDNGIHCFIQGENYHSMMGMGFIKMNIMVPGSQAEEAKKLLDEFRSHEYEATIDEISIKEFQQEKISETKDEKPYTTRFETPRQEGRRKRVGIAMLLSIFVTFGTGHLYVGEKFTFIVLALLEFTGLMFFYLNYTGIFIPVMIFVPILFDLIDSVRIVLQEQRRSVKRSKISIR